jgi:hypothetical protein
MKENGSLNKQMALTNGSIIGVALIFYSLLLWVLNVDRENWVQYLSYLIMTVGVVLALKQYREKNNGYLTYNQAFSNGFLTLLIATVLMAVYVLIFFGLIAPGEVDKMVEIAEEKMYESNPQLTDEQVNVAMGYAKMFMTPWAMAIIVLIFNTLASLLICAIVAAFMKKEKELFN